MLIKLTSKSTNKPIVINSELIVSIKETSSMGTVITMLGSKIDVYVIESIDDVIKATKHIDWS